MTKFAPDITQEARQGKFQAAYGCESLYPAVLAHLLTNSGGPVIVTGAAGTGKTRFVEGLVRDAAKASSGEAKATLNVLRLDTKLLSTAVGDIEESLNEMVAFLHSSPQVILFADDAAGLLGIKDAPAYIQKAGAILTPAILGGHIRSIITLRDDELASLDKNTAKPHIVQMHAFDRDRLIEVMSGLMPELQKRHQTPVDSSALNAAATLYTHYDPKGHPAERAMRILDSSCLRYTRKAGLASAQPELMVGTSLTALGDRVGAYDVVRTIEESTHVDIQGAVISMKNSLATKMVALLPNQRDVVYHVVDSLINYHFGFTPAFGPAAVLVLWGPPTAPKRQAVEAAKQISTDNAEMLNIVDMNTLGTGNDLRTYFAEAEAKGVLTLVLLEHMENAKPESVKALADYVMNTNSSAQRNVFIVLSYDTAISGGRLQVVQHLQKGFPDGFAKRCNAMVQVIAG